jgi:phosphoglycolate phosphatase
VKSSPETRLLFCWKVLGMKYKFVVFDWNGTLIDDADANLAGCNACLTQFGKEPITLERYRDTMDFPVIHAYVRNGIDPDEYLAKFQEIGISFLDTYKKAAKTAPLRRGAKELLDWMLDRNMTLMVLSNFLQHELELQMTERDVLQYFRHINGNIAFNELEHTRTTKLERLKAVMDEHGYAPEETVIIGDSLEEPDLARKLGLTAVSVTWGCLSKERLEKGGGDHLIDELEQLREILQR